jgi:hypothetical protein
MSKRGKLTRVWDNEVTLVDDAEIAIDEAYDYSTDVDLETDGWDGAWIYILANSQGTDDNIIVSIFASHDGGTTYDTVELSSVELDLTSGADVRASMKVEDLAHFRVGARNVGGTALNLIDHTIIYHRYGTLRY